MIFNDMNDIERYNFWEIDLNNFSANLWSLVKSCKQQSGLVHLYGCLNDNLKNPIKCNDFIDYIIDKPLTTDECVHILNALSPIKDKLNNWNMFVEKATKCFMDAGGKELTDRLLNVIV